MIATSPVKVRSAIREVFTGGTGGFHLWGPGMLVVPAFLLYAVFVLGALAAAVVISFLNWPIGGTVTFAGLANWRSFFDSGGLHAVGVTAEVVAISLIVQVPLSMALGIFAAGRQRYRAILSWIYVLPLLVSPTGIAITWARLFAPTFGGLTPFVQQSWLSNGTLAPIIVTLAFSWRVMPFYIILFQASVRTIPSEMFDAAAVDGASTVARLRHLLLPQLRHTIVVVAILCVTSAVTAFDLYFVMTGGGPNSATTTLSIGVYLQAFADQALGPASVYAVVVAAVGISFAGAVSHFSGFGRMRSQRQ